VAPPELERVFEHEQEIVARHRGGRRECDRALHAWIDQVTEAENVAEHDLDDAGDRRVLEVELIAPRRRSPAARRRPRAMDHRTPRCSVPGYIAACALSCEPVDDVPTGFGKRGNRSIARTLSKNHRAARRGSSSVVRKLQAAVAAAIASTDASAPTARERAVDDRAIGYCARNDPDLLRNETD